MISSSNGDTRIRLHLPPRLKRDDGGTRQIGIELELIGLELDQLSAILAEHLHGNINKRSKYEHIVSGDKRGEWKVELDFAYLKEKGRKSKKDDGIMSEIDTAAEELLRAGAKQVVPYEIVSPPLPMDELEDVEVLIDKLQEAGAQGTKAGVANAFGMQFNPELPDTSAATIVRYLKAFLCLFDWLKDQIGVDWTRRLTVYTDPFPRNYVRTVIDPNYQPSLAELIDDYLTANPTRNRALDMLPLFKYLDERRVVAVVDDPRVKSRPTLHYRLPNCEVDDPSWGLHCAWNDWLQVEYLAAEPARLTQVCTKYQRYLGNPLAGFFKPWKNRVIEWLKSTSDR